MKFAVRMEINDSFDYMDDLILRDFYLNGWSNWTGILYNNDNQLEDHLTNLNQDMLRGQ